MKSFLYKIGAWVSVLPLVLLPAAASAQLNQAKNNLQTVGKAALGDTGEQVLLPKLIGNIISGVLGILGIVCVIYVIYGGYLWMTDGGDGAKIKKAKSMIGAAIIGIALIVAAYSISQFVINIIVTASGA